MVLMPGPVTGADIRTLLSSGKDPYASTRRYAAMSNSDNKANIYPELTTCQASDKAFLTVNSAFQPPPLFPLIYGPLIPTYRFSLASVTRDSPNGR